MIITAEHAFSGKPVGFVVLEGVNGAGKSTLQKRLADALTKAGRHVLTTREPGGTPLGIELRAVLQEGRVGTISPIAELLLFGADRAEHVERIIKPALSEGTIVLCDRYFYSMLAFQGYGRGLDVALINEINETAIDGCYPDLVLLLDLDPAVGLRRNQAVSAGAVEDTMESESLDFHARIRNGFLEIARKSASPFLLMDASLHQDQVFSEAFAALSKLYL